MQMDDAYRSPSAIEFALLKKLLERDFPGRNKLLGQFDGLSVKAIDKEGSLAIKVNPLAPPAEVNSRVVSEGYYCDEDEISCEGPKVNVLLHVVKGKLAEIEIYKDDGSPIKKGPSTENLTFY
jgi:hypothetical protein